MGSRLATLTLLKNNMAKKTSFIKFFESRVVYLRECSRYGTAGNYERAKSSLLRYLQGKELLLSDINSEFVDSYEEWLMKRGMKRNSASFHLRILRAVYNSSI